MKYRHSEILASSDLGPSGTIVRDIDVADPISRITLRHEPIAGSMIPAEHPVANIIRFEIINGSDVLYGLTGQIGHGLNIFDKSNLPINQILITTGNTSIIVVNIDFGRFLWDEELAFVPTQFKNPQWRLTWNEANYNAACVSHSFNLWGHCFDEKSVSPVGFLSAKEIKAYVPVAGGFEYTDLPTDHPIRKLIVQPYRLAGGPRGIVDQYKLSEDNDKRILFDGDLNFLRSWLDNQQGVCEDYMLINAPLAGRAAYATASQLNNVSAVNNTATNAIACVPAGNQVTVTPATAAANVLVRASGVNPHACVCFPFGRQELIDDWYDVAAKGNIKLRLRGGPAALATDTVRIAVQQIRRY